MSVLGRDQQDNRSFWPRWPPFFSITWLKPEELLSENK